MARAFETKPGRAPLPAAQRPAAPTRTVPPAADFPQLARRLHLGAPIQRRAGASPGRDFSDIAGPGRHSLPGGLPAGLRADVEARSGLPMDDVRVHHNSPKPRTIGALAYAQGRDIHLGPGQERHLPHEAWHVVQQKQGRVRATTHVGGVPVNDAAALEREAESGNVRSAGMPPVTPPSVVQKFDIATDVPEASNPDVTVTSDNGRAGTVAVENLSGTPLGPSANAPSVSPIGWSELWQAGETLGNLNTTHYNAVRMHLWNGRLGGPGNETWNLAPGPAQINSSMSAGPETASKAAVSAGDSIWLETTVTYAANAVNAHDFASVIPNRMEMRWGRMSGAARGPAAATWSETIDLPKGSMSATDKAFYAALGPTDTGALDSRLAGSAAQTQAQAYAEVGAALKQHMLLTYPAVFLGMGSGERAAALGNLDAAQIATLRTTLNLTDIGAFYDEILSNLLGDAAKLAAVFGGLTPGEQKSVILYGGQALLAALGPVAYPLAQSDRAVFQVYDQAGQYTVLDTMKPAQIATLFHGAPYKDKMIAWAQSRGHATSHAIEVFLNQKLDQNMALGVFPDINRIREVENQATRDEVAAAARDAGIGHTEFVDWRGETRTGTIRPPRNRRPAERTNIGRDEGGPKRKREADTEGKGRKKVKKPTKASKSDSESSSSESD